jgi:serine/threonine protein kinase
MSTDDPVHALPPGYRLHEYRIERVLGHGGFGITYKAEDENLAAKVAIKEYLPEDFALRDEHSTVRAKTGNVGENFEWGLTRFLEEAQILARFRHPNIVQVLRLFRGNGTAYIVMPYEHGISLADYLKRLGRPLTEVEVYNLAAPLLSGLEAVHEQNLLHRDIKPGNIFIRDTAEPILLDFGSARTLTGSQSRSMTAILTPGYAPIEQYGEVGSQGPWTDIYGFAAVLYRCVTAKAPANATDRSQALLAQDPDWLKPAAELAAGQYSPELLEAIDWGLQITAKERPQSIAEWRGQLLAARRRGGRGADGADQGLMEPTALPQSEARTGRHPTAGPTARWRTGIMAAGAAAILLLPAAAAWLAFGDRVEHDPQLVGDPGEDNGSTPSPDPQDTRGAGSPPPEDPDPTPEPEPEPDTDPERPPESQDDADKAERDPDPEPAPTPLIQRTVSVAAGVGDVPLVFSVPDHWGGLDENLNVTALPETGTVTWHNRALIAGSRFPGAALDNLSFSAPIDAIGSEDRLILQSSAGTRAMLNIRVTEHRCDQLAADPDDSSAPAPGVATPAIDADQAVEVCREAVDRHPYVSRFPYQLHRALLRAGRRDEAMAALRSAAAEGHQLANRRLAEVQAAQEPPTPPPTRVAPPGIDRNTSLREVRRLAEAGRSDAQREYARRLQEGEGTSRDYDGAAEWYRRAADQGDAMARIALGSLYARGDGVPRSRVRAAENYAIAAASAAEDADIRADAQSRLRALPDNAIIAAAQRLLTHLDYRPGRRDGLIDGRTRNAVRAFQEAAGLAVDGQIGADLLIALAGAYF